jgi:hypothetical protein
MAWNREHAGVAAAPALAIDWSVLAMTRRVQVGVEVLLQQPPRVPAEVPNEYSLASRVAEISARLDSDRSRCSAVSRLSSARNSSYWYPLTRCSPYSPR